MTHQISFIASSAPFNCYACGTRSTSGFSLSGGSTTVRQCRPCTEWEVGATAAKRAIDEHKDAVFSALPAAGR